jgi:Uma2 family endonuclease
MTVTSLMTADELLRLPDDGSRYELVRGELRKSSPGGTRHGKIGAAIIISLGAFVKAKRLGEVYNADTGFRIGRNPDSVLAPEASFVRAERVVDTPKFFEGTPDVVFEVVSPGDSYSEVAEKAEEWLRAGTQAVVIVDPARKRAYIERPTGRTNVTEAITLEDVVPGWQLPLSELFE